MKTSILHSLNRIKRGFIVFVLLVIYNSDILATVYQDSYGIDYQLNYETKEAQVIKSRNPSDSNDIEPSGDIVIKDTISTINGTFTVKYVEENAFSYCDDITSVSLPKTIKSIGAKAFYECTKLTSITIPDSCHSIGENAFYNCSELTEIVIPYSVVNIGRDAFYDCINLKSVHITNLTSWCNIKFGNVNSNPIDFASLYLKGEKVTELIIPDSVTTINEYAFFGYNDLISITFPNSVTSINSYAFEGCRNLKNIILSKQLRYIGEYAFYFCDKLASITIPSSVQSIGHKAFSNCRNLEYIRVDEGNAVYDSRGDCNAIIETNSNTLVRGCKSTIIPESVVNIATFAFEGVLGLEKINIPQSVTSIGWHAFTDCSNLTSINLPNSLTEIQSKTFWRCQSLTDITIPENVTNIGEGAFEGCKSIANVYCLSEFPPAAGGENCFDETTYSNARLCVPIGFENQYQKADVWKNFKYINMDPNSVKELNKTAITPTEIYDVNGRPCTSMDKPGIYLIRRSDGSVSKKLVK